MSQRKGKKYKGERDQFQSKRGFRLAAIGSAVGMGNIWMFPYRVGEFGGGAFLIPYFIFIILIGLTGGIGEMAFGRAMGTGPIGAFKKAMQKRGKKYGDLIGLIPTLGSLAIAIGYSVVVGWILRFTVGSLSGSMFSLANSEAYFGEIAGSFASLPWHLLGLAITFAIMLAGIKDGIEKVNKILLPLVFLLFLILAVRVFFIPGSSAGYEYLFKPDWTALKNPQTWVFALGQAFFSLSLAGSGTLVYGSYLSKKEDIIRSAIYITIFDTLAAILAALVIIPAVFAFESDPTAGPPLLFITMPGIFKQMPAGRIFSSLFFIAVLSAGFTSLVNLFESAIEALEARFSFSRMKAVGTVASVAVLLGVFIENAAVLEKWMDVVSIYIIPLGALLAGIMFYWVAGSDFARDQVQMGREKKITSWFEPMSRYVFIGLTIIVYIMGIFYGGIG
ncbi:MAG: sodium-dependent transporter [Atopostipes suicloacalis]|nr:sodium-dependent transporter [Atopostipes suicloacalis]